SLVLSPAGEVLAHAASFAADLVHFDLAAAAEEYYAHARPPVESGRVAHSRAVSSSATGDANPPKPAMSDSPVQLSEPYDPALDIDAVYSALVLGTRDYVRKCGFSKALVALSGGIDSALVTLIARDALGAENVTAIGMPSPYSSTGSIEDSRQLAANLGIPFEVIAIDG